MKTNKFVNFILEISQVFLVFLGVYSAIMCAALSLSLPVNRLVTALVLLGFSFLFYGLFTVLETFRHGKVYGMLGITAFVLIVLLRFRTVILKGVVTIVNTYLKEFMNYTQTNVTLLSNKGFQGEAASVEYCTTLVIILTAGYLTALVSSCFYRKRRSSVYIAATVLFFFVPITVGKIGYFSNVVTYIFTSMAVVGTRFLRSDTTDKRMRQKLSLVLAGAGVIAGIMTYLFVSPERYANNMNNIVEVKNSALALASWDKEDLSTWLREYLNGDAMEYGRVGKKNSVNRTGKTLLKISGDFYANHGLYLKGYTGAVYSDNRWRQIKDEDGQYEKELNDLAVDGMSLDNWHVTLRNQIGDSQATGNEKLWSTGKLTIRNLAFGYGNYVVPYYPTTSFSSVGGRMDVSVPGIQYEVEYFPVLNTELQNGLAANNFNLAQNEYWVSSQANRERLSAFAKKYYLDVPEDVAGVVEEYKAYLNSQDGLLDKYNQGAASLYQIIEETRNYIMKDTEYTLSPGRTPGEEESVVYFLKENKKGYSNHYATAAAVLLRSIGIPTRYVEGLYVSKETLADVAGTRKEVEVTDKDIHAWVEVYQDNYGFVPAEFTPGMGDEDASASPVTDENSEEGQSTKDSQGGQDSAAPQATPTPVPEDDMTFENIETDNYNHEEEEEDNQTVSESAVSSKGDAGSESPEEGVRWWKVLIWCVLALVLLVVAAEGQRRIRIIVFKNNLKRSRFKKQMIMYYHHLERALSRDGLRYHGQSVAEYAEEIAGTYDVDLDEVSRFVTMVFCASFSEEQFDREQMLVFRNSYRIIRHQIYTGLKGVRKLYYMYILCL